MNNKNLNKWYDLHKILEYYSFKIKHTIDDWNHCYYNDTFDGHIEYDIDDDTCKIINKNDNILTYISDDGLNKETLSKYIIEYCVK